MNPPWGLRMRVLASAVLVSAVALVVFAVLLKGLFDQRNTAAHGRNTTTALNTARQLQSEVLTMESEARGYALTRSPRFERAYRTARDQAEATAADLARVEEDPLQRDKLAGLQVLIAQYARILDQAPRASTQDMDYLNGINGQLNRYIADEQSEQLRLRAQSNRLRDRAIAIASAAAVVLLGLIAVFAWGAERAVVDPIRRLQAFARELGAGRFGTRLPETGRIPETAELERAFNETAERLGRMQERHLAELDAVFSGAPLGLAFLSPDLRVLRVNEALARLRGRDPEDFVGRSVPEVLAAPELLAPLRAVAETGEPELDIEITIDSRNVLVSYFPVRGEDGALLAIGAAVTDVTARRQAEAARERLQAATAALAAANTVDEVAEASVAEARRVLGTSAAALHVVERGVVLRHVRGLSGSERDRWAVTPLSADVPIAEVVRTRVPRFYGSPQALLSGRPQLASSVRDDAQAFAALPLIASGGVIGVLVLAFRRPMRFDADERALLVALATQSAVALARAQLYEREHAVAQTLQASLLPRALPRIEGIDVAARLEAGAAGVEVGGDFYDVFAISEGVWGIAIGDVCGKGVDAAALTALARHTVRAAAHERYSPTEVLMALNRAVLAEGKPGQFLTGIFARLSLLPGGRFGLVFACGGHPPPVLLDARREPRDLNCRGTLLGVIEDPELRDAHAELDVGDTLLLYTDGLTEAGAPAHTLTTPEVAELLAAVRGETASQTAEACLREALAAGGGRTRDDIAVLVLQVGVGVVSTAGRTAAAESSTRGQR